VVKLKPCPNVAKWAASGRTDFNSTAWEQSPAFYVNHRGILTHRVRYVTTHWKNGEVSHYSVGYWCGNSNCFHDGSPLVDEPPKERLLCLYCEVKATAAKQKGADKIAGRHVHRGVLKAHRVCCRHGDNN
jgi:hypothetical protein